MKKEAEELFQRIKKYANNQGWRLDKVVAKSYSAIFKKGTMSMSLYWTKKIEQNPDRDPRFSTLTTLDHKKGRKQLTRKNLTYNELLHVFKNPRIHTNKGYYKKPTL